MAVLFLLALFARAGVGPPPIDSIRLFLGPMPDSDAATQPLPKAFKASYADLRRVHGKLVGLYRGTRSSPPLALVDQVAEADLVLTVTHRGPLGDSSHDARNVPTLVARLTVRRAGDTIELAGIAPGRTGRVSWTEQAERIYKQAVTFADSSHAALIRLRTGP